MRTIITIIIVLVLLTTGFFAIRVYGQQQREQANNGYQTVTAATGNLTATTGATGTVRANQTVRLAWQTTGTVEQVSVEEGEKVEAGALLAGLDKTTLGQNIILAEADLIQAQNDLENLQESSLALSQADQALAQARQAVIEAERLVEPFEEQAYEDDLEQAREDIVDAREAVRDAEEDFEPYQDWAEDNETRQNFEEKLKDAQQDYDEAVRKLEELELQKETADASLRLAESEQAEAEREVTRLQNGPDPDEVAMLEARMAAAQASLRLASLVAPFAGTVTEVQVKPGDQVGPGTIAFRIDDLSHLYVDVEVSEVDINRVRLGQEASVTFDAALDRAYQGVVTGVSQVGNTVQGIVQFLVTVELSDVDEQVHPGMTAAVNIVVEELDNVLLVPNRAVRVQDGKRIVYVLRNQDLEQVPITLGSSSETDSEVVEGNLRSGDLIVLNPPPVFEGGPPFGR